MTKLATHLRLKADTLGKVRLQSLSACRTCTCTWQNDRQRIPMETLCRFTLATAMRQDEIYRIEIQDVDHIAKTVVIRDRKAVHRAGAARLALPQ
jgi:hypothetical protein